jgi:hypothetical protein
MTFLQRLRALFTEPVKDSPREFEFELDYDNVNYDEVLFALVKKRIDAATPKDQDDMWNACMYTCYHSQRGADN